MKILVIQQKMIGDVLVSAILFEKLKKKYPNAELDYLINTNTIAVVEGNPFIDNIIEFKSEFRESKIALYGFLKLIRSKKYDLVVDAYGKLESNLVTAFSGAEKKISFYKKYTSFLYTKTVVRKQHVHTNAGNAIENRLRLIFEENEIEHNIVKPKIFLSTTEKDNAKKILKENSIASSKTLVMISVLGSSLNKTFPFEYMATLIDEVVAHTDANILFNYIPNQKDDAMTIYNLTKSKTQKNIHMNVFGNSLRAFLGLLSCCDMLIGNEGGAVNMAKALNVKTFTVFSPWIKKEAWNMFEDGDNHVSVHLNDFKPNFYINKKHYKGLKNNSKELYMEFIPDLIIPKLTRFLK